MHEQRFGKHSNARMTSSLEYYEPINYHSFNCLRVMGETDLVTSISCH